jgi:5-methyltetrahydrofolate--homocysteine methyltransferase
MREQLVQAIADMQEEEAIELARQMLDAGEDPSDILDASKEAMRIVGDRYDHGEYFLPELIISGELIRQIGELVKPRLRAAPGQAEPLGKVVLGTVEGDIHDIGKDIVGFLLDINNFEVHDLGVDVPAARFVDAIRDLKPQVVGMSGFLTLAFDQMKVTVDAIKEAGLREQVKIMIGGAIMDPTAPAYIGADAYGEDATAAVRLTKQWIGGD